ncbi:MAG: DUF4340 domain-containing protein [Treponema sp.]|nr:DUF4340 domain-containing protein [Treponema sp.]
MKKLNILLLKIFLLSLLFFIFSLVFSTEERSKQKADESALLNPGHKNKVGFIEITKASENEAISLKKQGDFWLLIKKTDGGQNQTCTYAEAKIVNSLLENAAKIRKIYKISGNQKDFERLKLSQNNSVSINFQKNDGEAFSRLYFGEENSLKNRIYFRSGLSENAFETENNFSQYLNCDINYWAAGEIFPEIKNPVNASKEILSLRHGKILENGEDIVAKGRAVWTLIVQDGNGRSVKLDFFEKTGLLESGEAEKSYFYKKTISPSEIDSGENIFAFYSENAVYEISEWTYERLKNAAENFQPY